MTFFKSQFDEQITALKEHIDARRVHHAAFPGCYNQNVLREQITMRMRNLGDCLVCIPRTQYAKASNTYHALQAIFTGTLHTRRIYDAIYAATALIDVYLKSQVISKETQMYMTVGQNRFFAIAIHREDYQNTARLSFLERHDAISTKAWDVIAKYDGKEYKTLASAKRAAKRILKSITEKPK